MRKNHEHSPYAFDGTEESRYSCNQRILKSQTRVIVETVRRAQNVELSHSQSVCVRTNTRREERSGRCPYFIQLVYFDSRTSSHQTRRGAYAGKEQNVKPTSLDQRAAT